MPTLNYKDSTIHYEKFGQGKQLLIALHGFADVGETYRNLETSLSPHYTVVALDLPLHGKTIWQNDIYTKEDIIQILRMVIEKYPSDKFVLMGHSMGTRLIMKVLPEFIHQVERLFFLAPDGIRIKGIFNMNLIPVWFRWWAKGRLEKSNRFQGFVSYLYKKGWISKLANAFIHVHLNNPKRRRRLLGQWISHQYFMTYPWQFARLIIEHNIPIDLFYGKKDKIIPPNEGHRFVKRVPHAKMHLLQSDHQLINQELNTRIKEIFE